MIFQCGTNDNHREEQSIGWLPAPRPCSVPECSGRLFPPAHLAKLRERARQEYS